MFKGDAIVETYLLEFYTKENGQCPVEEFINSTDKKMQAKIIATLSMLEEFGAALREPYSKHLNEGIFELRIKQSSNISRILYFFYSGGRIVLTNGFVKKAQRTGKEEISLAKRYRREYLERRNK